MSYSLVLYPDTRLDTPCLPVGKDEIPALREVIAEAINIMIKNNGIGIAANQIGSDKSFIAVMLGKRGVVAMINPTIVYESDAKNIGAEGCLSFPGVVRQVSRPTYIEVKFLDLKGEEIYLNLSHSNARVVAHECEHVSGKVFKSA